MIALTVPTVLFTAHFESLVLEAYLDSVNVWSWSLGVTNASGHQVYPRYKDAPQPLQHCVNISVWLMKTKYLPDVAAAFDGHPLNEAQIAAALSWHWNTGKILSTDWVKLVKAGDGVAARAHLEGHYLNGGDLEARRKTEAKLFFEGKWPDTRMTTVLGVSKPSYHPSWASARHVDISGEVTRALAT